MLGILKAGACVRSVRPLLPGTKLLSVRLRGLPAPSLMLVAGVAGLDRLAAGAILARAVSTADASRTEHRICRPSSRPLLDETAGAAQPEIGPDDPAYIMYTSGSTGSPQGRADSPSRRYPPGGRDTDLRGTLDPTQVHLQLAPLAFDASTFEIWGALLNGGKIRDNVGALSRRLTMSQTTSSRHGVTTLWLTAGLVPPDGRPSPRRACTPLRQLLAGGDVLSPTHVAEALRPRCPECQFINGYGPTENTTFTCCYRIPRDGRTGRSDSRSAPRLPRHRCTSWTTHGSEVAGRRGRRIAHGRSRAWALGYWNGDRN